MPSPALSQRLGVQRLLQKPFSLRHEELALTPQVEHRSSQRAHAVPSSVLEIVVSCYIRDLIQRKNYLTGFLLGPSVDHLLSLLGCHVQL